MGSTVAPRQLLPRDARRAQILAAAAHAFSHEGYVATSVEDVARQAGITRLIVYRHFESKADLYRAILDQVSVRLAEEWERSAADDPVARDQAVRTLLTVARELPDGFRLLFVHASREQEFAAYAEALREIQESLVDSLLGELIDAGPFHDWVVRMVVRFLMSAVLEWLEVGERGHDELFLDRASVGLAAMVESWIASAEADAAEDAAADGAAPRSTRK